MATTIKQLVNDECELLQTDKLCATLQMNDGMSNGYGKASPSTNDDKNDDRTHANVKQAVDDNTHTAGDVQLLQKKGAVNCLSPAHIPESDIIMKRRRKIRWRIWANLTAISVSLCLASLAAFYCIANDIRLCGRKCTTIYHINLGQSIPSHHSLHLAIHAFCNRTEVHEY